MDNARAAAIKKNNDARDRSHIQKLDDIEKPAGKQSSLREKQDTAKVGKNEDVEEISVAGRTKMQVPKLKNEGDQVPIAKKEPVAAEVPESEEDSSQDKEAQEASIELDSILKRSPSKYSLPFSAIL